MKWYALAHLGCEEAVQQELSRQGIQAVLHSGFVSFQASKQEAAVFLYSTKCSTRLLAAIAHGSLESIDVSSAHEFIPEEASFCVRSEVIAAGPQDTSSQEINYSLGAQVSRSVDLDNPEYTLFCQVGVECVVGIDVSGDLSKRYYRIFSNSRSMKGTLIASILELFSVTGVLLDPFGNTGEVCIEAAMKYTKTSPLKYKKFDNYSLLQEEAAGWSDEEIASSADVFCYDDQLGNLRSAKKNAKLAGVLGSITFSKITPEWMDVKFEEASVSCIVTTPPPVTKRNSESAHLEELCYQSAFVLKKKGRLVVVCLTPETALKLSEYADKHELVLVSQRVVFSGQLAIEVVEYGL
ncbi:MAG: hypothetical protein ACMXYD_03925 [Candidatus Woesearchaeota archaeon]